MILCFRRINEICSRFRDNTHTHTHTHTRKTTTATLAHARRGLITRYLVSSVHDSVYTGLVSRIQISELIIIRGEPERAPNRANARDVTHRNQYKTYFRMARLAGSSLTVRIYLCHTRATVPAPLDHPHFL